MNGVTTLRVQGDRPYDVVVGHGVSSDIERHLPGVSRVVVVTDERVDAQARRIRDELASTGVDVHVYELPSGEPAKSLPVVAGLWDELGRRGLTRNDALVAVGGGAITDVAGFAAATWLRGIRVVHVPTTLLAMVDAAIGGKTAINVDAGKNLVGAFHPPTAVVVDLDVLASLPRTEWVNGMAEVVKAGFIEDPHLLDLIQADPRAASRPDAPFARELVERSIKMKADVVSADLRESGPREFLNYGHTLGHAIERVEGYGFPHGHAVSIGLVYAAELGRLAGTLDRDTADRHESVLRSIGLPTTYGRHTFDELLEAMRVDKKARGATLRFIVLESLARPTVLSGPSEDLLRAAFEVVRK